MSNYYYLKALLVYGEGSVRTVRVEVIYQMEEEALPPKSQLPISQQHDDDDDDDQPMPDMPHQNPSLASSQSDTDSDSDSGSEDDEDDDEAENNLQLQNVEAELATNPSNYDSHVQVCIWTSIVSSQQSL